jgi:hypothetical protein
MVYLEHQYKDFIKSIKVQLTEYIDMFHVNAKAVDYNYLFICKYKDEIEEKGIDFSLINQIYTGERKKEVELPEVIIDNPIKNTLLLGTLATFFYVAINKRRTLENQIRLYSFYATMPYQIFNTMANAFNSEVAYTLFKGNTFNFGFGLSKISIIIKKRNFKTKEIDHAETDRLKKKLLAQGKLPIREDGSIAFEKLTDDNKFIVYYTDDEYPYILWQKKHCTIRNKSFYRFSFTNYITGMNITKLEYYKTLKTEEEILRATNIGNMQKLNALKLFDNTILNRYRDGI